MSTARCRSATQMLATSRTPCLLWMKRPKGAELLCRWVFKASYYVGDDRQGRRLCEHPTFGQLEVASPYLPHK